MGSRPVSPTTKPALQICAWVGGERRRLTARPLGAGRGLESIDEVVATQGGELSTFGVSEDDLRVLLDMLLTVPSAPFVIDPAHTPQSDGAVPGMLSDESVVITLGSLGANERPEAVLVAIDPSTPIYRIDNPGYHYDRSKCSKGPRLNVGAFAGSVTAKAWQYGPYRKWGSRWVHLDYRPESSWLHVWQESTTRYDAGVRGNQDGSRYSLYGGWEKGSGSTC